MNPVHLATLLAILDEGSFEDAASALGITPSAVSQRIKALEKSVGRVVLRRTVPVTATDAGEILAQSARRLALLQAETSAQLSGRLARLPLSVAVNADSLSTWFRPVLADVAGWEGATIHVRIDDESHSAHLLNRGDVIGAVTDSPTPVSGCEVAPLGVMRYYSVANPILLDRYTFGGSVDWAHMPVLRFGPRDALQRISVARRLGETSHRARVSEIPSAEAFVEAARVGLGWALLPEDQAVPLLESGQVVRLDRELYEVPLYWQRWRLESVALERLSAAVVRAAATLPSIRGE